MNPNVISQQHCVLAIDDDFGFLDLLKAALGREGYTVLTASTRQEAIRLYEARWREIDIVLLDYLLYPVFGDFVFDELQRLNPDVRIVLVTGYDKSVAAEMFQKGLRGYLQKPFSLPDLGRTVKAAISTPPASSAALPSPVCRDN